jgi:hypothetical protein
LLKSGGGSVRWLQYHVAETWNNPAKAATPRNTLDHFDNAILISYVISRVRPEVMVLPADQLDRRVAFNHQCPKP